MPMIALTFDDGPNTSITPQVLDILKENGAVASFFLIARNIDESSAQVARLQALLDVGRVSHAELSQQQATLAQSRLTATQADNNLRLSLLTLSQLLELESPEGFTIERNLERTNQMELTDEIEGVASSAIDARPEIMAEQLRLRGTENSIAIARAGYYPTLSFSAGLGTNYYTTSGFKADGFGKQLKNNFSQYLGLNLNIPIFNRFQTRNSIRQAKLSRVSQQLQLDQTRKTLYKEMQTAYYNAVGAREKLHSSEAKNNYLKTESDLTQARYEYLYQRALLQFYQGKPLRL